MARQSPDKSCIAPQILKTSEDLKSTRCLKILLGIFANVTNNCKTEEEHEGNDATDDDDDDEDDEDELPAHEEEDESNDAEDDDDHGQAREHCCCSEIIRCDEDHIYNDESHKGR